MRRRGKGYISKDRPANIKSATRSLLPCFRNREKDKHENPKGVTFLLTNKPDILTVVYVFNKVNNGSYYIMVLSNITLDGEVERRKLMDNKPQTTETGSNCEFD